MRRHAQKGTLIPGEGHLNELLQQLCPALSTQHIHSTHTHAELGLTSIEKISLGELTPPNIPSNFENGISSSLIAL